MRRLTSFLLLFGIAGSVAVVLLFSPFSGSSQEADEPQAAPGPPTGESTVLRLQAPRSVTCSATPIDIELFLDDLEARPGTAPGVNQGAVAFEVELTFNANVLQVEGVEIGPALSGLDHDKNGVVRSWMLAGPNPLDNEAGFVKFGGIGLAATPQQVKEQGIDPVSFGAPMLLAIVRVRTVGEGASGIAISAADVFAPMAPSSKNYAAARIGADVAVLAGGCAARLPAPTPYVPLPTQAPPPIPVPAAVYPLPPGLPAAEAGCVWWVSNPEPPQMLIIKYCGADQTHWRYDVNTRDLRQVTTIASLHDRDAFNCAPTLGSVAAEPDPECAQSGKLYPTPPPAAPGCRWVFGHLASGWVEGDASPYPPPAWDILVEVCADREVDAWRDEMMSGRAFDPARGVNLSVTPRSVPGEAR